MKRISNYHSHIALCGHATGNVSDYVEEAIKHHYEEIGISDHAPIPEFFVGKENHRWLWLDRMMTREQFYNDYLVQLDDAIKKYGDKINILKGLEIEYLPGHDNFYKKLFQSLDYLNLGVHYFDYEGKISSTYDPLSEGEMERYASIAIEAMSKGWFTTLVHPDLYLYHVKEFTKFHEHIARRLIEGCIKYDCYMEVNGNGKDKYPRREFWEIVKEYKDVKILINSDCHCVENFHGENIERVMKFSSDLGLNISLKMTPKPHKHETLYIGHRGASGVAGVVNNCLSGFKEGIRRDYFALECDVRVTTDKVYYIHHDPYITTYNNNFVKDKLNGIEEKTSLDNFSWDELKDLDLYYTLDDKTYYDKLILFEDYIKLCRDNHMMCVVELKRTNGISENDLSNLDGVFEIINKYDMARNTIIISFMKEALLYTKEHFKCFDIALLTDDNNTTIDTINYCIENGFSVDAYYKLLTKEIIDKMHEHHLTVNSWTVNEINDSKKLEELNIDYITTDVIGK